MAKLTLLFDEPEEPLFLREESTAEAWRQWAIYSCVERNRLHAWQLQLDEPEDYGYGDVGLICEHCPVGVDDIFPDGQEWLHLDFEGIEVREGRHNSPVARTIPVSVSIWSHCYSTPNGTEWDAGLDLAVREP